MSAYENNLNPMPEKLCIRNEDWSSSTISYESYVNIYEAICKKQFMSECKELFRAYAGNHMFKVKVPDTMIYAEDHYTIRGFKNAAMFVHVIALITGHKISLMDKDLNIIIDVEIDVNSGYNIYI